MIMGTKLLLSLAKPGSHALAILCLAAWFWSPLTARGQPIDASKIGWQASGTKGVVASGSPEAVAAGLVILRDGGNAVDAAVATILALGVTDYGSFAIGGEVPMLIYRADRGETKVLCGMGSAPLDPRANEWYMSNGIPKEGMRAAAVPSALSCCFAALKLYGTKSFAEVVQPTLVLLAANPADWHASLAKTYGRLIQTERSTSGSREQKLQAARDRVYKGDIADELEAWYVSEGGFLRKADLAAHETTLEDPVTALYRGYTVAKCGPWTQGPYLLEALRLVEAFDVKSMKPLSADPVHVAAEALKLALADRDAYYGDPRFVGVPIQGLLSDEYTRLRVPLIDPKKASMEVRPGDPVGMHALRGSGVLRPGGSGTTNCCVVDRWGNMVAATPSANPPYVKPGSTGITHGTRLSSLNTTPGHPNCIAPGKRPRITLSPTLVLKEGDPVLAINVAGGDLQDQVTLALLMDFIDYGMTPREAVRAPRFSTSHRENSFDPSPRRDQTFGVHGSLTVNDTLPASALAELRARGHIVDLSRGAIGRPVMIHIDRKTGCLEAAGDPAAKRHAGSVEEIAP
jgi:gamma-glutamyltranspeptidase/glutathione hydrolase